MQRLSTAQMLDVWSEGAQSTAPARALLLLRASHPDLSPQALGALRIGERDAMLLDLRHLLFGDSLACLSACPGCGEWLEFTVATSELRCAPTASSLAADAGRSIQVGEYTLECRPPDSADALALGSCANLVQARATLQSRCIVAARLRDEPVTVASLPPQVIETVAQRLAALDPQADVQLALSCAACANRWRAPFDIVAHLWKELDHWARRIVREVHRLASAYGWSEAQVLSLSSARRRAYLELLA